jgi:hypothetical protein
MRRRFVGVCLAAAVVSALGSCRPSVRIHRPADGAVVETCAVEVVVGARGFVDSAALRAELNGLPIEFEARNRGGRFLSATVAGAPLARDNTLVVTLPGDSEPVAVVSFEHAPPEPRARRISHRSDLLEGPLAHGQVGDWLLENCRSRFVVQDARRRDLHSIGQYGGNVIDAERVGREGRDQFFELQPSLNVETVVNVQHVEIVNDGRNGDPAILRACGPDDLLDYVNPSSIAADLGFVFPEDADDNDQNIEACTEYALEAGKSHLRVETLVMNHDPDPVGLYVGDYVNGMGELEQWTPPSGAVGEIPVTVPRAAFQSFFGFGRGAGVDYSLVPVEIEGSRFPTSSFTTSGVTFVAQSHAILTILAFGFPPEFEVPGASGGQPGLNSFVRFFGVGDGSPSNAADLQREVLGLPTGRIAGCVSLGGSPAPGARVAVRTINSEGATLGLASLFVTDDAGCYAGDVAPGSYAVSASVEGAPYQGGGLEPEVEEVTIALDETTSGVDFALPATGRLEVATLDERGRALPARVTVVGFDPSPEPVVRVNTDLAGFGLDGVTGTFRDISKDPLPFGITHMAYTGEDGRVEFDLEPGTYQLLVSRGTEYSAFDREIEIHAGATTRATGRIARVIDSRGFISSDYHVHMLNSPDSRIALEERVLSFAGEGVDNIIATDHDALTDLAPVIRKLGLKRFVHSTVGEEITSFDYGHFNGYPQAVDPTRPSGGSTDWAGAAPPGRDFPSLGSFGLSPAGIDAAAREDPSNRGLATVVQVNHIDSHFAPLKIDTSLPGGPRSLLSDAEKQARRFCSADVAGSCAGVGDLFHPFAALEVWNGSTSGAQRDFLEERIGIWMNLLNQGYPTTAIADTDTHTFFTLRQAGARTWTPSHTDEPAGIDDREIGRAVESGKAVGGQGIYVQARLHATALDGEENEENEENEEKGKKRKKEKKEKKKKKEDDDDTRARRQSKDRTNTSRDSAGFGRRDDTLLAVSDGEVDLEIHVQAPLWAPYDTIEIYTNASSCVAGRSGGVPVLFSALPERVLSAGSSDAGNEFVIRELEDFPGLPGAGHRETRRTVRFSGLEADAWFVVVVKGTPGVSEPMFPVFASSLSQQNQTLEDLLDGNLGEGGVNALGFTNALYVDVDVPSNGFDAPGVPPVLGDCL